MTATTNAPPAIKVRPVTPEEIEFFQEHGWVKVQGLIDRDTAANLLKTVKDKFGDDGCKDLDHDKTSQSWQTWFRSDPQCANNPHFAALAGSSEMGRNSARLLGRDSAIRLMMSATLIKLPGSEKKGRGTDFHQDTPGHPYLEGNFLTPWIALDKITPDMGAMQFYSGSHKLGNLGDLGRFWQDWLPHIERSCTLSEPIALDPGDATFHANGTIHGTMANSGVRPRFSWAAVLVPGDARYTGAPSEYLDGMDLEPYGQLDHPRFPVIYKPGN